MASKMNLTNSLNPYSIPFFAGGLFNVVIRWSNRNYIDTPEEMTNSMLTYLKLAD